MRKMILFVSLVTLYTFFFVGALFKSFFIKDARDCFLLLLARKEAFKDATFAFRTDHSKIKKINIKTEVFCFFFLLLTKIVMRLFLAKLLDSNNFLDIQEKKKPKLDS